MNLKSLILTITLTVSGCCGNPVVPYIPIPPEPDYPTIERDQLLPLGIITMNALRDRDVKKSAYIDRLRGLINTANGGTQ